MNTYKKSLKELDKLYNDTCDYFMIGVNDPKRKPTEREDKKTPSCLFFEFFTDFFTKVDEAIKQKAKKPKAGGAAAALKPAV